MGLFNRISDGNNKVTTESKIVWSDLTELKQLDNLVLESSAVPVVIFKHSTRCGISRMVLRGFEADYSYPENEIRPYFLDLLHHRDISDAIAQRFGVMHQSPQILLIKNGECVFDTSHGDIDVTVLTEKVQQQ